MKSVLYCLLLLQLPTLPVFATGTHPPPASSPARLLTSFPFLQFTGGVIVVKGQVNNSPDTLNFIMDTGSGGISLDSATCVRLKLPVTASNKYVRGIGGTKRLSFSENNTLVLPGLRIDSMDFHINDYTFISSVYGVQIDGIIGYSFFNKYIVRFDYDSMKVYVYSPGQYTYKEGGELLKPSMTSIPIVPAPLRNRVKVSNRYYFDMGAGLCLLLSQQFADDSSLFQRRRQRRRVIKTEVQGMTGKIEMSMTTVREFRIGRYSFHNVPTYVFDDVSNVTYYPYLGGLIGNDLLRRFNVVLNYPEKQIYLYPNAHFKDRFDYSYTGLIMYFIDGAVVVTDVIKHSPAEAAGFRPDDIILAVNNNFSNNIQTYRELLKDVGTNAHLIIRRNGELMEKKLRIKSILSR